MKHSVFIVLAFLLASCAPSGNGEQEAVQAGGVTFQPMTVERLPDLKRPRGHSHAALLGDEITVFGGHTDGFKPMHTAEFYSGGAWHEIEMMYTHDNSAAVLLPDGGIMLLGGTPEDFGVGQSWGVEIYDRKSHTFRSPGILDRKRARVSALVLPDGAVAVCGNWYAEDGIGIYREGIGFREWSVPSVARAEPFILPASDEEVILFASEGTRGEPLDGMVDVLDGEPFHVPLLDDWKLLPNRTLSPDSFRIAPFTYLMVARHREDGSFAVVKLDGKEFSLLDMDRALPGEGLDGELFWSGHLMVNRPEREAWMQGFDGKGRIYLACIDYDAVLEGETAAVSFYCASVPGDRHFANSFLMLPGNRFAIIGGVGLEEADGKSVENNFSTSSAVYIFHTQAPAVPTTSRAFLWAVVLAVLAAVALAGLLLRRKEAGGEETGDGTDLPSARGDLMSRITVLMEEKELFRRSDLKIADLASGLGTNVTYISACINGQAGVSFNEFVTGYRVRYAQALMSRHPGMKLSQVSEESGFSGERSFFRNFKKMTGFTPRQWVDSVKDA